MDFGLRWMLNPIKNSVAYVVAESVVKLVMLSDFAPPVRKSTTLRRVDFCESQETAALNLGTTPRMCDAAQRGGRENNARNCTRLRGGRCP